MFCVDFLIQFKSFLHIRIYEKLIILFLAKEMITKFFVQLVIIQNATTCNRIAYQKSLYCCCYCCGSVVWRSTWKKVCVNRKVWNSLICTHIISNRFLGWNLNYEIVSWKEKKTKSVLLTMQLLLLFRLFNLPKACLFLSFKKTRR